MLLVTLVLLQYLVFPVHGWAEVERGSAQRFDLDHEALELEITVPVNTNGIVDIHFGDGVAPSNNVIGWNIPEYRFTVTDCSDIEMPVDPHVDEEGDHDDGDHHHDNGDHHHDNGDHHHDNGDHHHDNGDHHHDNGDHHHDNGQDDYTKYVEPPTRMHYAINPTRMHNTINPEARSSFPTKWVVVKTSQKIEIYTTGELFYQILKSEANPLCKEMWWGADRYFRYMTVSEADTATVRYRPLRESMCPPSHPYVFDLGYRCCTSYTGPACDVGMSSVTECCATGKILECKEPPCHNYVYSDLEGIQSKLSSLDGCIHPVYDFYGVQYRGGSLKSTTSGLDICIDWHRTPAITGTEFDNDMGLTSPGECRNPDLEESGPWCYILHELTGELVKEACNVLYCDKDTQEDFEEFLLQAEEEQPDEEIEEVLLRLSQPIMSSQFTLGFHGAGDAIDGDFNTFALAQIGFSTWEAAISCVESDEFSVTRIVVYLHSTFRAMYAYGDEPDPLGDEMMVTLETLDAAGTGTMGVICTVSVDNLMDELHPLNERKEFVCPDDVKATKVFLSHLFQEHKHLAIREVEVYGKLTPLLLDFPEPHLMIDPSQFIVLDTPPEFRDDSDVNREEESWTFIDENYNQEQERNEESEDTTRKPSLEELQDGLFKLKFEVDLKNKRIKRIYLTENLDTWDQDFMLRTF